jgi:hypothetical protein
MPFRAGSSGSRSATAFWCETRLDVQIPRVGSTARGTVDVYYERDARLDMWVPVEMQETYMEMRGSAVFDNIGGEATYSNFRRFETSGRIL